MSYIDNLFNIQRNPLIATTFGVVYPDVIPDNPQGIYIIDKCYVGRSVGIRERMRQHFQEALKGRHKNAELSVFLNDIYENNALIDVIWIPIESSNENEARVISYLVENGCKVLNKKTNLVSRASRNKASEPKLPLETPSLTLEDLRKMISDIVKKELEEVIGEIAGIKFK
jgi:hypothetical protein